MERRTLAYLVLVSLFVMASSLNLGSEVSTTSPEQFNLGNPYINFSNIDLSSYYNLTGSKIYIDDSDPNYDWSTTATNNKWCSGSGTENNPYIIENVYFDGLGDIAPTPGKIHSENCITIEKSEAYFIVRNCFLTNSGPDEYNSGIYLRTVKNGILFNNTITYCHEGIYVDWYSKDNLVQKNRLLSDNVTAGYGRAVYCTMASHNNSFSDNYVYNYYDGIYVAKSNNITMVKNFVKNTLFGHAAENGLHFRKCNYSKITQNKLAGDWGAANLEFLITETECTGNIIENNTVVSSDTAVIENLKTQGTFTNLIALEESNYNLIAHNIYIVEPEQEPEPEPEPEPDPEPTPDISIPGYELFLIMGMICVISLFIAIRKKRFLNE